MFQRNTLWKPAEFEKVFSQLYSGRIQLDGHALAAFLFPFILYWLTLAPTIYNLDSAEFTTAVVTNGLTRATGYPLYLMVGKVWSWIPFSADMGYRMNLFSAFCGALTILQGEYILRRLQVRPWARLGALGLLASAPYFWSLSLIAEVYTLHTALMAGIILSLLRWADAPSPRRFALPVLLMALSMGNHAATVLLVPAAVWFVVARHAKELTKSGVWLAGGTAVLLGASIFLLFPFRYAGQPVFNYVGEYDATGTFHPVNLQTFAGVWWLITGQTFAGQMFGYAPHELWPQIADFGAELWVSFLAIGIGPGLAGMMRLLRRDWRLGMMFLLMFTANAVFYINYRVVDKATMFLPAYLIWAIWVGVGFQLVWDWIADYENAGVRLRLLQIVMVGAVILAMGINWRRVSLADDWSTREQSEAILAVVEPDAIIFGWWETVPTLQYLQLVEGQRPDITLINRFLISGADMHQLIVSEIHHRPIYINNPSWDLLQIARAVPAGPIYQLELIDTTTPSPGP
jgi:hypothetical protein